MSITWGPALDAEVAYRVEQIRAAAAPRARRPGRHPGRGTVRPAARAAAPVDAPAARSADNGSAPADSSERPWALSGSGAWPAAR